VAKTVHVKLASDHDVSLRHCAKLLLLKHKAAVVKTKEKEEEILVIGGGSLCFSFGTLFNDSVTIRADDALEEWSFSYYGNERRSSGNVESENITVSKVVHDGIAPQDQLKIVDSVQKHVCEVCSFAFPSRNQLFKHIKLYGHRINP
jgi:hypothetical protein